MGRFRIIETATSTLARIARHIARRGHTRRSARGAISIALVAFAVCVAPADSNGATRAPRAAKTGEVPQYHRFGATQYHEISRSSGATLAWLGESRELQNAIAMPVISRAFTFHSPNSIMKVKIPRWFPSADRIGGRNDPSIGEQIGTGDGRDPRLMLEIGAALGLCYVAFLAVWFWATRFRMGPPSSAPS